MTGALVDSSTGAAWGLAVGTAVSTTIWWTALVRGGAWRTEVPPTGVGGVTTVDDEVIAFADVDDDAPVIGRGP